VPNRRRQRGLATRALAAVVLLGIGSDDAEAGDGDWLEQRLSSLRVSASRRYAVHARGALVPCWAVSPWRSRMADVLQRPAEWCFTLSSMSGSGRPFTYSVLVPPSAAVVMQLLLSVPPSGNNFDGYEVRQVAGNCVHVTRRYVPAWALVVAILGVWFFPLGLPALLVRETEVLTVAVYEQDEGSYLGFSGMAEPRIVAAVNVAIDRLLDGVAMAPPASAFPGSPAATFPAVPAPGFPPQGAHGPIPAPVNNKICQECAETVRAAARSCRFCGYQFTAEPG
jgi:hypothetical protein